MDTAPQLTPMTGNWRLTRLSGGLNQPTWAIGVFAHNEARRIGAALKSLLQAADGAELEVFVLANGCTDSTASVVRDCAKSVPHLCLVEIDLADKANAWNLFVHEVIPTARSSCKEHYFFTDGDISVEPNALPALASALREIPSANVAGAMPASGRDRDAWRQRMVTHGTLAGGLYCLRGSFVSCLREKNVRMPAGLIGDDFLVSWLVASEILDAEDALGNTRCVFHADAQFSFKSLSPWRIGDYRTYLRRKWRYTLRALQYQMLVLLLSHNGLQAMPKDVRELYRYGPLPSRLSWVGLDTPFRFIAVLFIRTHRN